MYSTFYHGKQRFKRVMQYNTKRFRTKLKSAVIGGRKSEGKS
jgi:hypothetical protein